jgi:hypothetical protein
VIEEIVLKDDDLTFFNAAHGLADMRERKRERKSR